MFISLMTGQTETTEIKMNMRNINNYYCTLCTG
ncbi:hypothetical protein A1S5_00068 [Escherichia coli KTE48]|nr:hypothetical protein A1S5_00068 [Escherichia coli KTE48]